jgi:phosphoesterase RecJ-like protein
MIKKIADILLSENDFLVATHINPDGDAVGSLLGMTLALQEMGKRAWAHFPNGLPPTFEFLPGRNLLKPDPAAISPAPRWIIALDTATENRIAGDISGLRPAASLINIDHHRTNPGFGHVNLIDPLAASTAEIVHRIIKAAGRPISAAVAKCLYTGLVSDTGCFRFGTVTSSSLQIGAELLSTGVVSYEVTQALYEENPMSRIRLECLVLERVEILLDGALAVSTVSTQDLAAVGATQDDTENLVDRLRQIQGVEVGALITQVSDKLTRASLRSKGRLDVSAIAAGLGGGGHRGASGLRAALSPAEVKREIVKAVEGALNLL